MVKDRQLTRREFSVGVTAAVALASTASLVAAQTSEQFDLVILIGRVMDPETNFDQLANVGVKDGRIVAKGRLRR